MNYVAIALIILPGLAGIGCDEDEVQAGFMTTTGSASEGDGTQTISVDLGKRTSETTTLTFQVAGDAALDGDYTIDAITDLDAASAFTILIPPNQTTAEITFNLIDDQQIEPYNEVIYFQITGSSNDEIANNIKRREFAFEIIDNDVAPAAGLQVDLSWTLGDNVRINASNFDLYLASDITIGSSGVVESFEKVDAIQSTNERGFESFIVDEGIEDGQYYVVVNFVGGTYNARVYLHMTQGSNFQAAAGNISTDYIGKSIYYGPITKAGRSFSLQQ